MIVDELLGAAEADIQGARDDAGLEQARVRYLGRKGEVTALLKGLGKLAPEERPQAGAAINAAKRRLTALIAERKDQITAERMADALAEEAVDVTLPGRVKAM